MSDRPPEDTTVTPLADQLRIAAALGRLPAPILFPGWAATQATDYTRGVRAAARAILGADGTDAGTPVTPAELAALVRYIGDTLEGEDLDDEGDTNLADE